MSEFSKGKQIVVVDDDKEMRSLLSDFLTREGYSVQAFESAPLALSILRQSPRPHVDALISDINMPEMSGMEFLSILRVERPGLPIILITAFGSVDAALDAMRKGAFHYVIKPFKLKEMVVTLEKALEQGQLIQENTLLREEVKRKQGLGSLLGKSAEMQKIFELVQRVAQSNANILISGESGTGKEMVARSIHESGMRKKAPFIAINCSAIPETLLESELFGHAKGSFTGATQRKRGLIEEANGGTLFLDEIGDMSPVLQAKLLRVLQERKIRPVGDNNFYDVEIRVIAATHKDLKTGIKDGTFREDLYYRLSVIPILIPPLRDRKEDIPLLAEHFLEKFTKGMGTVKADLPIKGFTKAAVAKLMGLPWAGNVREIENVVERAVVLCTSEYIDAADIPDIELPSGTEIFSTLTGDFPTLQQLEERYMKLVLQKTMGRKDRAAKILGVNRRTLYRKEREYGWVTGEEGEEGSEILN